MSFKPSTKTAAILPFLLILAGAASAQFGVSIEERADDFRIAVIGPDGPRVVHTTQTLPEDATARAVQGTPVVTVTWTERHDGQVVPYYAVSLDGNTYQPATATSYILKLRYAEFDPLVEAPSVPRHLDALNGGHLWIVQYWTQGLEAYRNALRERGVSIHLHLWNNANVVEAPSSVAAGLTDLPFVRAVVPFHPAYKLDEQLLTEQRTGFAEEPIKRVNILSVRRGLTGQQPIADRIREIGGTVNVISTGSYQMHATLDTAQIADVARMDAVQFVDLWAEPEPDMDIARTFHGATYIQGIAGFDGTGTRGEVADTGTEASHAEFQSPPLTSHGNIITGSHGTSTYGQIFASGVNAQATGLQHNGQGVAATWGNYQGGSRYNHTAELVNPALPYRCNYQTNSGGHPLTTSYTSDSQDMDLMVFDFSRFIILQSHTVSTTDDNPSGASRGPAADGRVKPELASFYDNIFTTSPTGYTSSFGGTSGATPIVAGCFGLFFQMWHGGIFGNPTGATVFDSAPQNTTARAFIIAGATQWDFVGGSSANSGLGRDQQGWGHPDLQTLYDYSNKLYYVDETDILTNFQSTIHPVTVLAGEPFFKATLVWRDNPGTVASTQHLINDLNLKVTSPNGTIYRGNVGLTNNVVGSTGEALWSSSGGTPDSINSVENVFVQNPLPGTWLVEVSAPNLNQDTHVETPALDADYALCVLGVLAAPPTFFNLTMNTSGVGDLSIAVDNIPSATTQGYCIFAEGQSGFPGSGPVLGIQPTLLTLTLLGSPLAPGNLFHWTWPVASIFPDTPISLGPGAVPASFFPLDAISVGLDPAFMITGITPLRRVQ